MKGDLPIWRTGRLSDRLADYLSGVTGRTVEVRDLKRYTAGTSWVTASFRMIAADGSGEDAILRIGDPNGLLAPYSSLPEYQALTLLADRTSVPVPRVLWHSDDPITFGAPFQIATRLKGDPLLPRCPGAGAGAGAGEEAPSPQARQVALDAAQHLAAIHSCDWRGTPAEDLTPGVTAENCTRIEIDRWIRRAANADGELEDATMRYTAHWLRAHARSADPVVLLHGDYRIGNFLVEGGRISGILDWELTHLGDPMEDIGWATIRTFESTDSEISGLLDRQAFAERYSEKTGRAIDPERVKYFQVLGQFKMAAMLVGCEQRLRRGQVRDIRLADMALQKTSALTGMIKMIETAA